MVGTNCAGSGHPYRRRWVFALGNVRLVEVGRVVISRCAHGPRYPHLAGCNLATVRELSALTGFTAALRFRALWAQAAMADSETPDKDPLVNEEDVKAREREKLDIGDDHPQDRDIRPRHREQGDDLDVGDPHPAGRDTAKSQ